MKDRRLLNGWYESELRYVLTTFPESLMTNDLTRWWMYSRDRVARARGAALWRINIEKPLGKILSKLTR
jgi:hypothetical protein